jgi:hypothetical protein
VKARTQIGLRSTLKADFKQHNAWFDEECLGFLDQRKHAKMQWLQAPNQSNVNNVINLRYELVDISGTKRKNTW